MSGGPTISTADTSDFTPPDDMKFTMINQDGPPYLNYPVLEWGGYIYWPLSYVNNRVSFGIVITDEARNIIKIIEAVGDRYIENIEVDTAEREVRFIGQYKEGATVSWDNLEINVAPPPPPSDTDPTLPDTNPPTSTVPSIVTLTAVTLPETGSKKLNDSAAVGSIVGAVFGVIGVIVAIYFGRKMLQ